ncbi:(deoxy)nucleoside triphosphate pyrophosphohydrolase [Mycobacterium sp. NPDC006124]|uniref:(deoxy)nucleoside triphosphate pyrophosphohydrolase n=1 Tax=Mycobacterium sp. NPDC006124 TaxID=3156729 RepID=UPI0033B759F5
MPNQIVVAGAVIVGATLLVAQRDRPPHLAGLWELPGGKAMPGETDAEALARELDEELGVAVSVGARLSPEVSLGETTTLRAYLVTPTGGTATPRDHRALRWVTAEELDAVEWVPADRAWLPELAAALRGAGSSSG